MNRILLAVTAAIALSVGACSDNSDMRTSPFVPVAVARVNGVVTDATGAGLDSVRVFIALPNTSSAGYAVAQAVTNRSGEYSIDLLRMSQFGERTMPDTVRVEVSAIRLTGPTVNKPAGTIRVSKVLAFGVDVATAPFTRLDFQFNPPLQ